MNAHAIQQLSQWFNPLFALALIVCAARQLRKSALFWIVCVALSVGVAQQISKIVQQSRVVNENFPSTHFAVALAIAGAFWALNRRFAALILIYLVAYGCFIVWRQFHAPLDLMGAFYGFPMGFFAARFGTRRARNSKIKSN